MDATPTYDSAVRRSPFLREIVELVRFRDLLSLLIGRTNKTRYRRSALGVTWTLLNPLLNMAVLTFAFSHLFRFDLPRYPVYVLTGLIAWNFFSQTTTHAMNTLIWGGSLLRRIYLPRGIFAVASIGNGLVNLGLAFIPLLGIMLLLGQPFYSTWWFVPIAVLLWAMFSLGVALFISTLALFFHDVVEMWGVLLQAWYFLTPIMYPKEIFPARWVWYLNLNPMHNLLELFRVPIYLGHLPGPNTIAAAVAEAVVALVVGWWAFTRKADEIAYRV